MNIVTIHKSGLGADKLEVISHGNGWAYSIQFGEAGHPMRSLWFQDDDAFQLRGDFEALEDSLPEEDARNLWLSVLDPYL